MSEKRTIEFACHESKPIIRETPGKKSRIIEGIAIVFNKDSAILCDGYDTFREVIKPGAITMSDLLKYDITMTAFHNREKLLARWHPGGKGTLHLSVDSVGVHYSFEAPNSPLGDEIVSSVGRGDMIGASFTFAANGTKQKISTDPDGVERHTITKLGIVSEMTIAANPAYPDTTVAARELAERKSAAKRNIEIDSMRKRNEREAAIRETELAAQEIEYLRKLYNN